MIDYSKVYNVMKDSVLQPWLETLEGSVHCVFTDKKWGDLPQWLNLLQRLPDVKPSSIDLSSNAIRVGFKEDLTDEQFQLIPKLLEGFFPWRKGPFDLFGTFIDTEWRSDLKWDRFKDDITSLQDRVVLDVGCGSGYHCLRMKGAGAQIVTGIDPTMLYPVQFQVFNKYINDPTVSVLPIGIDDMPDNLERFDTVFSMGLLYHRRAPLDHIHQLKSFLRKGGELVLETLVIEGAAGDVLSPAGRYAKMPNVWFIPSVDTLASWIKRCGFKDVTLIDVTTTTNDEQRKTAWIQSHSLEHFLDPKDPTKTCEGYPAPMRAVFKATKV